MLKGQPSFATVLQELLSWIGSTVNEIEVKHYPLLAAHNGFVFDNMLVMQRRNMSCICFRALNVQFSDALYD